LENPIPTWASDADVCASTSSCDACGITNSQYCKYSQNGDVNCCKRALLGRKDEMPSLGHKDEIPTMAGVSPITENPIPSWATDSDLCVPMDKGCDACNSTEYCKYTADAVATCCARSSSSSPAEVLMAGVSPIIADPIPSWASRSDVCGHVGSCDACTADETQYCKYNKKGQPKCCKKAE